MSGSKYGRVNIAPEDDFLSAAWTGKQDRIDREERDAWRTANPDLAATMQERQQTRRQRRQEGR